MPMARKVDQETGLSNAFHVIVRFDTGFKNICKGETRRACMEKLQKMNIALGMKHSNLVDVGVNTITKLTTMKPPYHLKDYFGNGKILGKYKHAHTQLEPSSPRTDFAT